MDGACCALSSHPEAGWSLPPFLLSFYFLVTFYAEAGSSLWRWDIIIIIIASRSKAQSGTQSSPRCGARTQVQAGSRSSPEGPASSCPAGAQQEDPPAGSASLRNCAPWFTSPKVWCLSWCKGSTARKSWRSTLRCEGPQTLRHAELLENAFPPGRSHSGGHRLTAHSPGGALTLTPVRSMTEAPRSCCCLDVPDSPLSSAAGPPAVPASAPTAPPELAGARPAGASCSSELPRVSGSGFPGGLDCRRSGNAARSLPGPCPRPQGLLITEEEASATSLPPCPEGVTSVSAGAAAGSWAHPPQAPCLPSKELEAGAPGRLGLPCHYLPSSVRRGQGSSTPWDARAAPTTKLQRRAPLGSTPASQIGVMRPQNRLGVAGYSASPLHFIQAQRGAVTGCRGGAMPRGRMCTGGLAGTSCAREAAGCQRPWPRPAARSRPVSGRGLSREVGVRLPLACPLTRTRVCTFGLPLPLCVWGPFPLRTPVRTK